MTDTTATAEPSFLDLEGGHRLAYHRTPAGAAARNLPGIVFLGGFASDMTGTKATALEAHAKARGLAFLRFDYQGHGQSSGRFEAGSIGLWASDAVAALDRLTEGPQILVGSSMGGWLMLLAALARPARVAGLVGIAAAPDFTEDLMWEVFSEEIRDTLTREGAYHRPSEYGDALAITRHLIDEGRSHLLLRGKVPLTCPVRLIQGDADLDVPWRTALRIAEALESDDVETVLVKGGDHRLSRPEDLTRLNRLIDAMIADLPRPVTATPQSSSSARRPSR